MQEEGPFSRQQNSRQIGQSAGSCSHPDLKSFPSLLFFDVFSDLPVPCSCFLLFDSFREQGSSEDNRGKKKCSSLSVRLHHRLRQIHTRSGNKGIALPSDG
jgi:hypothetical protein